MASLGLLGLGIPPEMGGSGGDLVQTAIMTEELARSDPSMSLAALATLYHPRRRRALARVVPYSLFFMVFYAYITVLAIAGVRGEWKGSRLPATHAPAPTNPAE
jgi:hypothetical protein